MAWGKAGSTTLSTAGSNIEVTGMTSSETNLFLHHMVAPSTNLSVNGNFDNDTGSNYADRCEFSGGTDTTATSQTHFNQDGDTGNDDDRFTVWYWCNVAGEEKLGIGHMVNRNTAGAGNPPPRAQMVSKYTTTSGQFTEVDYVTSTGTQGTDSNLTVLGSELTPANLNLPDGTLFVEKDTANRYWLSSGTWSADG